MPYENRKEKINLHLHISVQTFVCVDVDYVMKVFFKM